MSYGGSREADRLHGIGYPGSGERSVTNGSQRAALRDSVGTTDCHDPLSGISPQDVTPRQPPIDSMFVERRSAPEVDRAWVRTADGWKPTAPPPRAQP